MWRLVLQNSNHPQQEFTLLKSSFLPLIKHVYWKLMDMFYYFHYNTETKKCWYAKIVHSESGAILTMKRTVQYDSERNNI